MGNAYAFSKEGFGREFKSKIESLERLMSRRIGDAEEFFKAGDIKGLLSSLGQSFESYRKTIQSSKLSEMVAVCEDLDLIDQCIRTTSFTASEFLKYKACYEEFKRSNPNFKQTLIDKALSEIFDDSGREALAVGRIDGVCAFYDPESPVSVDVEFDQILTRRRNELLRRQEDLRKAQEIVLNEASLSKVVVSQENLGVWPTPIAPSDTRVSVGDLHGNALKLIYILIKEGFLSLGKEDYEKLCAIYSKESKTNFTSCLTQADITTFEDILSSAVCSNQRALTLIGDVLCDRGANDYLTLLVLKKLSDSNVDVDIMLSNHDSQFIRDYELNSTFTGKCELARGQGVSLERMNSLINRGVVSDKAVRDLVALSYLPMVKAISYIVSPDKKNILISTHAPVGLEVVEKLATKFGLPYNEDTIDGLIGTIDAINANILTLLQRKKLYSEIEAELGPIFELYDGEQRYQDGIIDPEFPLQRVTWSRAANGIRTTRLDGQRLPYNLFFEHGHIGDGSIYPTHTNLDNKFGKSLYDEFASNTVGYSQGFTSKRKDALFAPVPVRPLEPKTPPKNNKEVEFLPQDDQLENFLGVLSEIRNIYGRLEKDQITPIKHLDALEQLHKELNDGIRTYLESIEKNQDGKAGFKDFYQCVTVSVARAEKQFKDEGLVWNLIRPLLNALIQVVNTIRRHVFDVPEYGLFKSKSTQAWGDSEAIKQFKAKLELEKIKFEKEANEEASHAAGSNPGQSPQ